MLKFSLLALAMLLSACGGGRDAALDASRAVPGEPAGATPASDTDAEALNRHFNQYAN